MGMIFVRSKDGISHNPLEWSSKDDCTDGANVLYHTLLDLAGPVAMDNDENIEIKSLDVRLISFFI